MLTRRQKQAYDWIAAYIARHYRRPTYREIADGLGVSSTHSAVRVVRCLIERGALRKTHRGFDLGQRREFYVIGRDRSKGWPELVPVGSWPVPPREVRRAP